VKVKYEYLKNDKIKNLLEKFKKDDQVNKFKDLSSNSEYSI